MADTIKVLGQVSPSATTLTDAYTVPGATSAVVSSITVCNRDIVGATFRVSIAVAGAADNNKQYLYYDSFMGANSSNSFVIGISLAATDKIRVYASTANFSFNIFGVEIT